MNFRIHMYEEVRREYEVSAPDKEQAIKLILAEPEKYTNGRYEFTGDFSNDICVDPILADGSVDYDKSEFLSLELFND